ncbi:uncharacterized protein [Pocillopora verrucosa]|nr:uncharacterized protein LOC131770499 isoform X2 [Pocillopora verrucosa]XP_058942198.1 uncharacterized protein LOC131770499 isoform X2 [Pocillopora verrucosa]XP_058942199.1 uncharacterized protein LOC131770499 isoform X2 [Pocillopora verrucosa]
MLKLALVFMVISCVLIAEARRLPRLRLQETERYQRQFLKNYLHRRSCVAVGGTGCEANNSKCCRKGNPFTGTMRSCVNTGSFSTPEYTCVEA